MIVVMENGYAATPGTPNPGQPPRGENLFERVVVEELVPQIDAEFRTLADRDHRAIAGLSMGGGQAARIGFGHLDLFGSIGCMSSGGVTTDPETPVGRALQDVEGINARLRLLWIGCGREDRLYERSAASHEALTKAGVEHVWFECDGAHEWQAWRKHLHELAQRLFRD
jgi:enterochelin esterase family protein